MARTRGTKSGAREIAASNPIDGGIRSRRTSRGTPVNECRTAQLEQRAARVARSWTGIVVAFEPPAGTRGGPFEVTVSDEGEVVPQRFER